MELCSQPGPLSVNYGLKFENMQQVWSYLLHHCVPVQVIEGLYLYCTTTVTYPTTLFPSIHLLTSQFTLLAK